MNVTSRHCNSTVQRSHKNEIKKKETGIQAKNKRKREKNGRNKYKYKDGIK
jgi:hypothetical protein